MILKNLTNGLIKPKLQVKILVIKACTNCGAPGVDSSGRDVGIECPNCGKIRPSNIDKGIVYENTHWWGFKRKINKWLRRE